MAYMKYFEALKIELKNNYVQHLFKAVIFALFFLFATANILKTLVVFLALLALGILVNAWVHTFYRKF